MTGQGPMIVLKDDVDTAAFWRKFRKYCKILLIIGVLALIALMFYKLHGAFPTMDLGG